MHIRIVLTTMFYVFCILRILRGILMHRRATQFYSAPTGVPYPFIHNMWAHRGSMSVYITIVFCDVAIRGDVIYLRRKGVHLRRMITGIHHITTHVSRENIYIYIQGFTFLCEAYLLMWVTLLILERCRRIHTRCIQVQNICSAFTCGTCGGGVAFRYHYRYTYNTIV